MTRTGLTIAGLLLLMGVFALLFFYLGPWSKNVILLDHNRGIIIDQSDCRASLSRTDEGTALYLESTCSDDRALWKHLASNTSLTQTLFDGVNRLYLGGAYFSEGPFLICDVLARLKKDREWTPDIDSLKAAMVLERILPNAKLSPSVNTTLINGGKFIKSVSLEIVRISNEGTGLSCAESPVKIPISAVVDIALGAK